MPTKEEVLEKFRELYGRVTDCEDDVLDLVEHFFGFSDSGLTLDDKVVELSNRLTAAEDRASKHDNEIASYRGEIDDLRMRVEELESKLNRGVGIIGAVG